MKFPCPSWGELNEEARALFPGHCGPNSLTLDLFFRAACAEHDFHYWRGGDSDAREWADKRFLRNMRAMARRAPWYRRLYLYPMANSFYRIVRALGSLPMFWSGKPLKTWTELYLAVQRGKI